ncbi:MAG TPA: GEVED domain-containing protein [Chitinophagales bacterium]|nr:GEVED domain-containing protein [Chitinophagales bacterium]
MNLYSTNHLCKNFICLFVSALIGVCCLFSATAQTVTIPTFNNNDSTASQPLGCFYGYERTEALYLSSDISTSGYITQVAFYVNSVNAPASSTPVVIKLKTTSASTLSGTPYDSATLGATTVWSGNVTSSMLSADSWVTFTLTTPFNYTSNNLEVFVETNYGSFGGENSNAKGFRQHDALFNSNQYWEQDGTMPTDDGEINTFRPNIQLTFGTLCTGTPNPGNTISNPDSVCTGSPFTLSMGNISAGGGLTYQWRYSVNGTTLWTAISGATNSTLTYTQTSAKYYHCVVICSNGGGIDSSVSLKVNMQLFYHCYCGSYAVTTEDTKIDSVELGTMSTGSDPFQCESYTDYTGVTPATLSPGQPSTIHIANGSCTGEEYEAYVAVYIDLNHNSSFTDANELVYSYGPIYNLNSIPDGTFFLPVTAMSGTTGMRIVLQEGSTVPSSCGTYTRGETEDYLVSLSTVSACSGVPVVGDMNSTLYSVCPNEHFTLSLDNYLSQSGLSYLWQYSTDLSAWNPGGTSFTWTDSQIVAHYFRCRLICSGGNPGYSDTIQVTMNPFYQCYCSSYSTAILGNDTKIDTVQFGTINAGSDPNHCESYTDNTNLSTNLPIGVQTTIRIVNGSCDQQFYESYVAVYIDYNGNGDYADAGELAYSDVTTGLNSPLVDGITPPISTLPGITGMRVIIEEGDSVPSPCGLYQFGETEDYLVNLVISNACYDPPTPGTAVVSPTAVCANALPVSVSLTLTDNSSGTGQTYQWEDSSDGAIWNEISGQTNPTGSASVDAGSTIMYYRCQVHCGATTLPSVEATVTVNPTPVGDTITDAIFVGALPYTDIRNNLSANCYKDNYVGANNQPSPDVFYTVTTSALGHLEVRTCFTTDLNTVIHILDENGADSASNDDNGPYCAGVEASDSVHTTSATQTWYIVVEGQGFLEGSYQLDIDFVVQNNVTQIPGPASEISLFPNPNNGTFDLSFDLKQNINDVASVSITNVIGQVVDEEKIAVVNGKLMKEISLGNHTNDGLFFVNIRVNDLSLNQRFIVQQ